MRALILGASGRAAAHSALRAGFTPVVIDLFADLDLGAVAECRAVPGGDYPEALFREGATVPADAWFYTGALENCPDLVDAFAGRLPLWGVAGGALNGVRDPFRLDSLAHEVGFLYPEVRRHWDGLPRDGSWLRKPRRSAGGLDVRRWHGPDGIDPEGAGDAFSFQKEVAGQPVSALFVADGGRAVLKGIVRSKVGSAAGPYAYRGSLAPWPVASAMEGEIARIGGVLASRFGLRGLFGIDLICNDQGPWLIEVNPRYTASVEVVELASGLSLVADHAAAFGVKAPPREWALPSRRYVAKEVLYAERDGTYEKRTAYEAAFQAMTVPAACDLPHAGTPYRRGDPLLTVMAAGETVAACEALLAERVGAWRRDLGFV